MTKEEKFNSMVPNISDDPKFAHLSKIAFSDPKTQDEHGLKMWAIDELEKMLDRKPN